MERSMRVVKGRASGAGRSSCLRQGRVVGVGCGRRLRALHDRHEDHERRRRGSPDQEAEAELTPGTLEEFLRRVEGKPVSGSSPRDPHLVHLVGTGPGDPELLTLKAVRLMKQADVVLYDRLISAEILEYVNEDCLMIYVGKERGLHTRSQGEIHELLYRFCTSGKTVVRLKGGDPYVFGRGGEELEYLQERGVEVRCVPGITAASGISSSLGIPLTHRGVADNVQFITGHLRGEFTSAKLKELAQKVAYENTTVVIYMGLNSLPQMSRELMDNGMDPGTAAVAVERGTMANQRTVFAPLESLSGMVEDAQLESPTLIVVGNVVTLSPTWQGHRGASSGERPSTAAEEQKEGEGRRRLREVK
ncbi:uroporphiryn-III C-methyltransferase [Chloropicon primus]|uniref:uroporphyrinogen-III C-methyltransferase n=2 Tax=Chloropicon primus TaxID=1764295 RepID=A0A5B8MRC2_9CHLO|nr:uroporphiryn-III C-methyltransferase [Chloropicon primus]UPR01402.1 uroporphiryn-III C-methyltransferase [Chloropicon primus]|eukprot:QDZ22185.1 uroporphiryn-III C-methyltransferase [Chloropicon primus]